MSVFARLKKAREEKKGFTLVELIVVLVILAILAAILVPALLGWIDEAKKKQYQLEARNVYVAAQALADEWYAKADDAIDATTLASDLNADIDGRLASLADLDNIDVNSVTPAGTENIRDSYTIVGMDIAFTSAQDGATVNATLSQADGWVIGEVVKGS